MLEARVLSIRDAAQATGLKKCAIERLIKEGKLHMFKIGAKRYVSEEELLRIISNSDQNLTIPSEIRKVDTVEAQLHEMKQHLLQVISDIYEYEKDLPYWLLESVQLFEKMGYLGKYQARAVCEAIISNINNKEETLASIDKEMDNRNAYIMREIILWNANELVHRHNLTHVLQTVQAHEQQGDLPKNIVPYIMLWYIAIQHGEYDNYDVVAAEYGLKQEE